MSNFKPRFKEGSLVNISMEGVVTAVMKGKEEQDTFYNVFIHGRGDIRRFISCDVIERIGGTDESENTL